MAHRDSYEVSDIWSAASGNAVNRVSKVSKDDQPSQSHSTALDHDNVNRQPFLVSQSYDPASDTLFAEKKPSQPRLGFYARVFTNGWGWEFLTWLLAAMSLLALLAIFAHFHDKPLSQWHSRLAPNTIVSILSQVGQTAVLVSVTSSICQSMWLWLGKENHATDLRGSAGAKSRLSDMQVYDDGSRGPLGSLLLLWHHPKRYVIYSNWTVKLGTDRIAYLSGWEPSVLF